MNEQSFSALLIGVCDYGDDFSALPFCERDVSLLEERLTKELGIEESAISTQVGHVTKQSFVEAFDELCRADSRVKLLYFSGHGDQAGENHFLVFSDKSYYNTQGAVERLSGSAVTSVAIIDSCYSGLVANAMTDKHAQASERPLGSGTFILDSCHAKRESFPRVVDGDTVSVFTDALCTSIWLYARRNAFVDLVRVADLCCNLMERYNEGVAFRDRQNCVMRNGLSGPLVISAGVPKNQDLEELSTCVMDGSTISVLALEPTWKQRYEARIVLSPNGFESLPTLIQKACELARSHGGPGATIRGWIYPDEVDRAHRNWLYRFCCPADDEKANAEEQMTLSGGLTARLVKNSAYEVAKAFIADNTADGVSLLFAVSGLLDGIDCLWRRMDAPMSGFVSQNLTRQEFICEIGDYFSEVERLNSIALNLVYGCNVELENLCNAAIGLAGTVRDVESICSPRGVNRDDGNLRRCLIDLRARYNEDYYKTWTLLQPIKNAMHCPVSNWGIV